MANTAQDLRKIPLLMTILIILPESIPFIMIKAPHMIPSVCLTEDQKVNKLISFKNCYSMFIVYLPFNLNN